MRTDQELDIEIDLVRAWENPSYVGRESFDHLPPTPRQLWMSQQRHLYATATSEVERKEIGREMERISLLEMKALRGGLFPHLFGTGTGGRGRSFAEDTERSQWPSSQTVAASPTAAPNDPWAAKEIQQRLTHRMLNRGRF